MFNTGLEQFILYCAITESLGEPVYQVSLLYCKLQKLQKTCQPQNLQAGLI